MRTATMRHVMIRGALRATSVPPGYATACKAALRTEPTVLTLSRSQCGVPIQCASAQRHRLAAVRNPARTRAYHRIQLLRTLLEKSNLRRLQQGSQVQK